MEKVSALALEYTQMFLFHRSNFRLSNCHRLLPDVRAQQTLGILCSVMNNHNKKISNNRATAAAFHTSEPLLSAFLLPPHFSPHKKPPVTAPI